jgi:hypothetical protein
MIPDTPLVKKLSLPAAMVWYWERVCMQYLGLKGPHEALLARQNILLKK